MDMKTKEYEIIIKGDTNDADYVTEISPVSKETLDKLRPLILAIAEFKKSNPFEHSYPLSEYCRGESPQELYPQFDEETHELFREYCPRGESDIHSIESILVAPTQEKEKLV